MRIDLIITELFVGGAERCAANLAVYLKSQGHGVRVVSLGERPYGEQSLLVCQIEQAGVQIAFLDAKHVWHLRKAKLKLKELINADRPDVAQSFLFHANVLSALTYPTEGERPVRLVGGYRVAETRRWMHPLARWASSRMHRIVCVSESVRRWAESVEKVPGSKLVVIPNGVPLDVPSEQVLWGDFSIPEDAAKILFVGRLDRQKGVDQLVDMAVRGMLIGQQHLVLVGEGPLRKALERRIRAKGMQDRIHLVGWQPNPRDWIRESELLVLPARYEGMPNVLLEAMAEGKCVLAMDVEGVRECLGSGPHADEQIVRRNDWELFSSKTQLLMSDRERRESLASANHAHCVHSHNLQTMLARYERLYRDLVKG